MLSVFFNLLGAFTFLFIFWRRLKEDYVSNMVFTTSIYLVFGAFAGKLISFYFLSDWWFWLSFLGLSIGLAVGILRFKLRAVETVEAAIPGLLLWFSFLFLQDSIESLSAPPFIAFLVVVLLVGLFYLLDKHYKKFAWYKSGRIGFSGLTTLGALFLIRAFVAAFFPDVLSFVGTLDIILSAVIAFIAFLLVFNLARQRT